MKLRDWIPHEFMNYLDDRMQRRLDDEVIKEYTSGDDQPPLPKQLAKYKNVYNWCVITNGDKFWAVGWNENPSVGWSFPICPVDPADVGCEDWNWRGLSLDTIRDIVNTVSRPENIQDKQYRSSITVEIFKQQPNVYTTDAKMEYLQITLPVKLTNGTWDKNGFVLKIFEDGFFCFENGFDVKLHLPQQLSVAQILIDNLKTTS